MNLETKITIYKFTPQLFTLTHNWEAPAKRHIDSVRVELIGGNRDMSLSAYKAGYNEGLKRRELKGDIEL